MPATPKPAPFRAAAITHYGEPWTALPDKIDYIAFAREICPSTQRVHYQSWAYASRAMKLSGWKKVFPGDHIEQMRGTFAQNDAYCNKETQCTTFGVKPMENGKKRSLADLCDAVMDAVNNEVPLCDVVTEEVFRPTFVQYNNGISKLYDHAVNAKMRKLSKGMAPEVTWVYGPPGCGKTRYVHDREPGLFNVPASDKYKWKDGFSGQSAVLYDNVTPENISPTELLVEIDRYLTQVPKKGGFIGWRPERVYLTSVFRLECFASIAKFSQSSEFTRRVTRIVDAAAAAVAAAIQSEELGTPARDVMGRYAPVRP